MTDRAILIQHDGRFWRFATMTVRAVGEPHFSHYASTSDQQAQSLDDALAYYHARFSEFSDLPIGVLTPSPLPCRTEGVHFISPLEAAFAEQAWAEDTPSRAHNLLGVLSFGQDIRAGFQQAGQAKTAQETAVNLLSGFGDSGFSPTFPHAEHVFIKLIKSQGHLSRAAICSTRGIELVYNALCIDENRAHTFLCSNEILTQAATMQNAHALRSVRFVLDAIASLAGDFCLEYKDIGALSLTGPLIAHLQSFWDEARFLESFTAKGAEKQRLQSIVVDAAYHPQRAFLGLAAAMAKMCTYQVHYAGPLDVMALDAAWEALPEGAAFALDRKLRLIHQKQIPWFDRLCGGASFTTGAGFQAVLAAMAAEGILDPQTSAADILRQFDAQADFSFRRFGMGARTLECSVQVISGAGFVITQTEVSDADFINAPVEKIAIASEHNREPLILTSAEEVLDAAVSLSPLVVADEDTDITCNDEVQSVLIVEQNLVNRMVMKAMLAQAGYDLTLTDSASEAVRIYTHCAPDIVLMDVEGDEGMSGLDATRRMRAHDAQSAKTVFPLIIGMIPPVETNEQHRAMLAGMDDCVAKPISHARLQQVIQGLYEARDMGAEKSTGTAGIGD